MIAGMAAHRGNITNSAENTQPTSRPTALPRDHTTDSQTSSRSWNRGTHRVHGSHWNAEATPSVEAGDWPTRIPPDQERTVRASHSRPLSRRILCGKEWRKCLCRTASALSDARST